MKIDKLNSKAVATKTTAMGPMALTQEQLREASAGIEPFSCVSSVSIQGGIQYHNGYPRAV